MVQEDTLSAVLSDFARTMVTDFPVQDILDHLVQRIVEILPVTGAGVTLISPGSAPHYVSASSESALRYEQLQSALVEGPCLLAFHTDQPVLVPDLRVDSRFPRFGPQALASGLGAVFTFPLRQADRQLGALDLYRETQGPLKAKDVAAAQTLADVATAYLINAQARDEARLASEGFLYRALHDPLTGLPNRALLKQRIEHAAARARRSHANAAVLFADLDRFKQVNDSYGHQIGDELLIAVAHRFAGLVRAGDTLARVSGDEFVFLCEDVDSADDADMLARRVGESCQEPFLVGDVALSISVSVGMAFAGLGIEISEALVVDADTAMYQVKRKGGGRSTGPKPVPG
jgi:diguanylate cyclase (GGDEF)-like protein